MPALRLTRGAIDELQELAEVFFFRKLCFREFHANAVRWRAARGDATYDHALHPQFAARHPEANLEGLASGNSGGGFNHAPAATYIGQISPDRLLNTFNMDFNGNVTLDASKAAAI